MSTIEKLNFLAGNYQLAYEFFDFWREENKNPWCELGEQHEETWFFVCAQQPTFCN